MAYFMTIDCVGRTPTSASTSPRFLLRARVSVNAFRIHGVGSWKAWSIPSVAPWQADLATSLMVHAQARWNRFSDASLMNASCLAAT
ncbi:hypothetical protein SAMN05192568_103084 [Methylobacterium pseudosasicola]|uniref:Uncharacterized protein n=1 Tax=Methylobacterium pseudosasicola TaxID=582667 RepID=A0A1I4QPF0_9HYPH|nr:hypothetical protein SAMN05192568_103084 [Methylobacterium pseudosasicola]